LDQIWMRCLPCLRLKARKSQLPAKRKAPAGRPGLKVGICRMHSHVNADVHRKQRGGSENDSSWVRRPASANREIWRDTTWERTLPTVLWLRRELMPTGWDMHAEVGLFLTGVGTGLILVALIGLIWPMVPRWTWRDQPQEAVGSTICCWPTASAVCGMGWLHISGHAVATPPSSVMNSRLFTHLREDDRYRPALFPQRSSYRRAIGQDQVRRHCEQFCRVVAHYVSVPGPAIPDREVTSLDPSELPQTVFERGHARLGLRVVGNQTHQHADPPDALRLRAASGNAATAPPRSVMNSRRL